MAETEVHEHGSMWLSLGLSCSLDEFLGHQMIQPQKYYRKNNILVMQAWRFRYNPYFQSLISFSWKTVGERNQRTTNLTNYQTLTVFYACPSPLFFTCIWRL